MTTPIELRALLGDYPGTRALKGGSLESDRLLFDFAPADVPNRWFKEVVRDLSFDVAGVADPAGVERARAGSGMVAMLLAGDLDAAVLGAPAPPDSPLRPLIPDPEGAARQWCRRNHAVPVNHLVVLGESLSRDPGAVREIYELLAASRRASDSGYDDGLDLLPFGIRALRPSLEVAVAYAAEQGLLSRKLHVDELFDATTLALG